MSLAFAIAVAGADAWAAGQTYTLDADFDLGTMAGVNHTSPNNNQLQLNKGSSFPVLWIANAGEDTLSKLDSGPAGGAPGKELARYRTWFNSGNYAHDAWNGAAPSRTAVNVHGEAYVANRGFASYGYSGHAYVFKILTDTFVDRNGNGVVDTVVDTNNDGTIQIGEMKPLVDTNGNNVIDPSEIQDERIAWAVRIPDGVYTGGTGTPIAPRYNAIARSLCIGTDGNLWVGMYNNHEYWKISGVDGHTIAGPVATSYQNYGCVVDQNGNLWGASWGSNVLTKIANTASDVGPYPVSYFSVPQIYGLALVRDAGGVTHVIMGGSGRSYVDFNTATSTYSYPAAVNYTTYAVGADNDGNILVSKLYGGVAKFAQNGSVIWDKPPQSGSPESRGVIADAHNDVFQVHRTSHNVAKYKGSDGAALGLKGIGYEPYTYSDASGTQALSVTSKTGTWTVIKDGGAAGTPWGTLAWNASVPTGASVTGQVRASDTIAGLALLPFQPVTSGAQFNLPGRYAEIQITLNANTGNESPIVYDVTLASRGACDVNMDGSIDRTDISLITSALGQRATAGDPRDLNGDGLITINDARGCVLKCSRPNCATQ